VAKNYNSSKRDVAVYIDSKGKEWRGQLPPDFNSTASLIEDLLARQRRSKSTPTPETVVELNTPAPQTVQALQSNIKATKPRKPQIRPGLKADGTPATREYIVGVKQCEAVWLRERAELRSMALSRMMVGIGLGQWALPENTPKIESEPRGWTTVSVTICDDDWDQIVRNAAVATWPENYPAPASPEPVTFCVLASLGVVKLVTPDPVPVLATVMEHVVLSDMRRACSIARLWNPWLMPRPDIVKVVRLIEQVEKTLAKVGIHNGRAVTEIHNVVEQIEAGHTACIDCTKLWTRFELAGATLDIG
jgi:hypothetical protein